MTQPELEQILSSNVFVYLFCFVLVLLLCHSSNGSFHNWLNLIFLFIKSCYSKATTKRKFIKLSFVLFWWHWGLNQGPYKQRQMCYLTWKFQWNHISLPSSPKKIKHYIPDTWQCRQTAQQTALPAHPLLGTLSTFPSTEWELADYIPMLPTASNSSRESTAGISYYSKCCGLHSRFQDSQSYIEGLCLNTQNN